MSSISLRCSTGKSSASPRTLNLSTTIVRHPTPHYQIENLIYSAPTSAGKTLVSELLLLRNLVREPSKVALVVLPYVSLITEKENKLRKLLIPLGLKLQSIHSHKSKLNIFCKNVMTGCIIMEDTSVLICTIEKTNQLMNKIIEIS
jgi:DNA polymerase theta